MKKSANIILPIESLSLPESKTSSICGARLRFMFLCSIVQFFSSFDSGELHICIVMTSLLAVDSFKDNQVFNPN